MTRTWCKTCQLEHSSGHCPVVASTVEQIEGYQQHLERKFWEQAYIAILGCAECVKQINSSNNMLISEVVDIATESWRKRWGKK